MPIDKKLNARQKRAIAAMMQTPTIEAAAAAAGIGARTLHRWLAEDGDFQAAVSQAQRRAVSDAIRRLAAELVASADTIAAIRDDTSNRAAVRLQAASKLPALFVQLAQYGDLEERLEALEAAMAAGGRK